MAEIDRLSELRNRLTKENPQITVDFSCIECGTIVLHEEMAYQEYVSALEDGFFKTAIPHCKAHPLAKVFFDGYFPP